MKKQDAKLIRAPQGDRMYMIREHMRRMSKAQLAAKVGKTVATITAWEDGRNMGIENCRAVAEALDVSLHFLWHGYETEVTTLNECISFAAQQGMIVPEQEAMLLNFVKSCLTRSYYPYRLRDKE